MKKTTKLVCLLLAAMMLMSFAGCGSGTQNKVGSTAHDTSPLTLEDTVKVVAISHPSWPTSDGCKAWEYIKEGTGANVEITSIPSSDFVQKITVMFAAPELLPDLMTFDDKNGTDFYIPQGAFIPLDDYADVMPNYTAWVDSLTEEEYNAVITTRKAWDGKIYFSPTHGREAMTGVRAWLYREDLFKKHNLKVPTTKDELIDVCRKLKELYPDSYPFCIRQALQNVSIIGSSWKPYFESSFYYDFENEVWEYGPREDTMLEVIEFYKLMIDEGLAPPDMLTINTGTWQELVATGKGMIFPEYQARIDFFDALGKKNVSPDYQLKAMVPPVMNEKTGVPMVAYKSYDMLGYVVCNTMDEARITNAMKYLDWFYTDEAMELLSWGKEGETYEVVDGKKRYITDENGTLPDTLYGFTLPGTAARFDPAMVDAFESASIAENREMVLEHTLPNLNPRLWIAFNDEERNSTADTITAINAYANEMIHKFILGQEPLSGFEAYQNELNELGVDDILKVYEEVYNRLK